MSITVAISGINAIDNPGPGTGIARSLKESGLDVKIIGLAYDVMEPGNYMDWVIDKSYILPYPSGDSGVFMERLQYINSIENIDVIIPCLDAELPVYIKMQSTLESFGIKSLLPTLEAFKERDKNNLDVFAEHITLKCPKTKTISSYQQMHEAIEEYGFPVMIKGPFYEAEKVFTYPDAEKQFNQLAAKWGFPLLVQQFIHGEEYNLVGLGDGVGNDLGHVAVKKMMITKQGKTWTNVSIQNPGLEKAALAFVKETQWAGGYELEVILDYSSGEFNLIEINPRFPAWSYMATGCGINLPKRMIQLLLGQPYESHSDYQAGNIHIRYTDELIKNISDFETLTTNGETRSVAHEH